MSWLYQRSIEIILQNQSSTGAYIACPNFPIYHYCWYRDGSFTAYAMNLAGKHDSASAFHKWAADTINKNESTVNRAIRKIDAGDELGERDILHTRYAIDGSFGRDDWPNFQLDGFGTWLWAVREHSLLSGQKLSKDILSAVQVIVQYLSKLWKYPCFDCWEEFPQDIHSYTLGAIYAGINASVSLIGEQYCDVRDQVREFILNNCVSDGKFVKYIGIKDVDGSLIGLGVPYGIVALEDPIMQKTIAGIESTLRCDGGIHRYNKDTYYGGGEWLLLTAWLGWYYAKIGALEKAKIITEWIESQANNLGWLPEQIPETLIDSPYFEVWRQRWGEIASPLLWSHAQYIILANSLNEGSSIQLSS